MLKSMGFPSGKNSYKLKTVIENAKIYDIIE